MLKLFSCINAKNRSDRALACVQSNFRPMIKRFLLSIIIKCSKCRFLDMFTMQNRSYGKQEKFRYLHNADNRFLLYKIIVLVNHVVTLTRITRLLCRFAY